MAAADVFEHADAALYQAKQALGTPRLSRLAKNDPTDTGGLFIGRRPGTAPLRYRALPVRAGASRRRLDGALASALLAAEIVICLTL